MDGTSILFWLIGLPTLVTFVTALARHHRSTEGWIFVCLGILITLTFAWLRKSNALVYAAAGMWVLFVVTPSLLASASNKKLLQQDYEGAYRVARIIVALHPFEGWREQPKVLRALSLAAKGELATAVKLLKELENLTSPIAHTAMINLYRMTSRWEEFLAWANKLPDEEKNHPSLIPLLLRGRGETGDLRGAVEFYAARKGEIAKLAPPMQRDFCRLALFAFSGRVDLVHQLFAGTLALLPETTKRFWLATAKLAAGEVDEAQQEFELQLGTGDGSARLAIERRLSVGVASAAMLEPGHREIVEDAAVEQTQEEVLQAKPPLFSWAARGTVTLIALNVAMFVVEVLGGGATNGDVLYNLGAMFPPAVHAGERWRLIAALFLHFGVAHIIMNMFALSALGPFVEQAFGFVKFMAIYFIAGIGSMLMVMTLSRVQFTVGASGAILGLVGATAALMLKGWLRRRALPARQRLISVLLILGFQTMFDLVIPQVSMTAHLSGAMIGFATALLLPDQLIGRLQTKA